MKERKNNNCIIETNQRKRIVKNYVPTSWTTLKETWICKKHTVIFARMSSGKAGHQMNKDHM